MNVSEIMRISSLNDIPGEISLQIHSHLGLLDSLSLALSCKNQISFFSRNRMVEELEGEKCAYITSIKGSRAYTHNLKSSINKFIDSKISEYYSLALRRPTGQKTELLNILFKAVPFSRNAYSQFQNKILDDYIRERLPFIDDADTPCDPIAGKPLHGIYSISVTEENRLLLRAQVGENHEYKSEAALTRKIFSNLKQALATIDAPVIPAPS